MKQLTQEQIQERLTWLEEATDYSFAERRYALSALTHPQGKALVPPELQRDLLDHVELAWVGDAVLHILATIIALPEPTMGARSTRREHLTCNLSLTTCALQLNLQSVAIGLERIHTAPGVKSSKVLATTMEAIIGAIFEDTRHNGGTNTPYHQAHLAAFRLGILPVGPSALKA